MIAALTSATSWAIVIAVMVLVVIGAVVLGRYDDNDGQP